jgi:putative SOS response-associated peptidase YedK
MCNFFSRYRTPNEMRRRFKFLELPNDPPRYVVRPTDRERVVAIGRDGARHFVAMRWGLVPAGAADVKTGLTLFNWRSEDVRAKRAFAEPFRRGRRCLVPCDGFFEFAGARGSKQPYLFKPKDDRVMAFAGLWEQWRGAKDAPLAAPLLSFSIATTSPNATVSPYHNRMPVVFASVEEWDAWLDPQVAPKTVHDLLAPAANDLLMAVPVTRDLLKIKDPGPAILRSVAT